MKSAKNGDQGVSGLCDSSGDSGLRGWFEFDCFALGSMEGFLNRYRSITVLLLVIFAQLLLIAVRVKNKQDVRVIRVRCDQ